MGENLYDLTAYWPDGRQLPLGCIPADSEREARRIGHVIAREARPRFRPLGRQRIVIRAKQV